MFFFPELLYDHTFAGEYPSQIERVQDSGPQRTLVGFAEAGPKSLSLVVHGIQVNLVGPVRGQ